VIYRFAVGRLSCAVVSDGQMEPPLAPPLEAFFTPGTGVPEGELRAAVAVSRAGPGRTSRHRVPVDPRDLNRRGELHPPRGRC